MNNEDEKYLDNLLNSLMMGDNENKEDEKVQNNESVNSEKENATVDSEESLANRIVPEPTVNDMSMDSSDSEMDNDLIANPSDNASEEQNAMDILLSQFDDFDQNKDGDIQASNPNDVTADLPEAGTEGLDNDVMGSIISQEDSMGTSDNTIASHENADGQSEVADADNNADIMSELARMDEEYDESNISDDDMASLDASLDAALDDTEIDQATKDAINGVDTDEDLSDILNMLSGDVDQDNVGVDELDSIPEKNEQDNLDSSNKKSSKKEKKAKKKKEATIDGAKDKKGIFAVIAGLFKKKTNVTDNSPVDDNQELIDKIYANKSSLDDVHITDDVNELENIEERESDPSLVLSGASDAQNSQEDKPQKNKKEKVKKEKKEKVKKAKPKKEKKPKKAKPKKTKTEKAPKEPVDPSELVMVTPFTFIKIIIVTVIIVAVSVIGGSMINYNSNMKQSKNFYENSKFDKAYDRIVGMKIKKADIDYYNKLRTIMIVYMNYDSYINFIDANLQDRALDVLISGVKSYEDNYSYAEENDAVAEFDRAYGIIVDELAKYGIDADKAHEYLEIKEQNTNQYFDILNSIGGIAG